MSQIPCMCGKKFNDADKYMVHAVECPSTQKSIQEARKFSEKYKNQVMQMDKNQASNLAGMCLTRCRHLGMTADELRQLVAISISAYEKEVDIFFEGHKE